MKIAGFNLSKISIEKKHNNYKNLKINTNIDIKDIKEAKADFLKTDEEFLNVTFSYTVDYDPDCAKIEIVGSALIVLDKKEAKDLMKDWKDSKKISPDIRVSLFKYIITKTTIKALNLEDEMNLPLHINLVNIKTE
jgi:hypothetical protein